MVHHSLPIDLLDNVHDDDLDEAIMAHYRAKWSDFRRETELDTNEYLVDQDTKETVIQALQAHESGLYRLVSRTLMAEIERVIRVQLRGKIVGRGLNVKETILSEVDDLPMSSFHDLTSSTMQYEAFEGHLYEQIDDENDRSRFADNPIPNRHAALHGLVPYSSEKSSLNSIFLMDFVLQTTTQAKRARIAEAADILKGYVDGYAQACWSLANRPEEPPRRGVIITLSGPCEEHDFHEYRFRLTMQSLMTIAQCTGIKTCGEAVKLAS